MMSTPCIVPNGTHEALDQGTDLHTRGFQLFLRGSASEDKRHHSPSTLQCLLSKPMLVPFVRTMSCDTQIDHYKYQCAGNSAIEPLTRRRGHASNGEINRALRKVMRCDRRMEGRVSGKLVVGLSIFIVGASRFEGCQIGVAVVLDAGCENEEGERDEGPYRGCLYGEVDEGELVILECRRSFDPDGNAKANVESHAQDPMADPHGTFRGTRKVYAFVQASHAL